MANVKINSTFSLRKINPKELHDKYTQNVVESIDFDSSSKLEKVEQIHIDTDVGNTENDPVYEYTDSSTNVNRIYTTNNIQFSKDNDTGKNLPENKMCNTCNEIMDDGIGVPLDIITKDNVIIFPTDGYYCSFEHMIPDLSKSKYKNIDVNHYTRVMFSLMYPDKSFLKAVLSAKNPELLNSNGGPMDLYNFKSNKHRYVEVPGYILSPAKRKYLRVPNQ